MVKVSQFYTGRCNRKILTDLCWVLVVPVPPKLGGTGQFGWESFYGSSAAAGTSGWKEQLWASWPELQSETPVQQMPAYEFILWALQEITGNWPIS